MEYRDYYADPGSATHGLPGRDQEGLPQARPPGTIRTSSTGDKAAEQRFKDVNEANEVLSDPDKRSQVRRRSAPTGSATRRPGRRRRRSVRSRRTRSPGSVAARAGKRRRQRPLRIPRLRRCLAASPTSSGCSSPAARPAPTAAGSRAENAGIGRQASGGGMSFDDLARRDGLRCAGRRAPPRPGGAASDGGAAPAEPRVRGGQGRDQPRRGVPRHEAARRGRRQAARGEHPARASTPAAGSGSPAAAATGATCTS